MEIKNLGQAIAQMAKDTQLTVAKSANFFAINEPAIPEGTKQVTVLAGAPEPVVSRDKISLRYAVKFDGKDGFLSKNFIFGGSYATSAGRTNLRNLQPRVAASSIDGQYTVSTVTVPSIGNINVAVFNKDVTLKVSTLKHPALPTNGSYDGTDHSVLCEQSTTESYAILA